MRAAQTFQNKPTDHARAISRHYETGVSPTATLSHWAQASSRAGKTNLFHMRGGRFHAGNT